MFDTRIIRSLGLLVAVLALVVAVGLRTAPTSTASATPIAYVVQPGDTLWGIADAELAGDPRAGIAEIQDLNDLDGTAIAAGQTLLLPAE